MNYLKFLFLLYTASNNLLAFDERHCERASDASRVVVAGGSLTEILYFLGEEDKIIALDVTSNYPKETSSLPSIGYVRNLSAEGLISMDPSIIIGEDDMGPPAVIKQVRKTSYDLRIIQETRTLKGILEKIECVAGVLGVEKKAQDIISLELKPKIQRITKNRTKVADMGTKVMLVLSMQSTSPIVAGSNTSGNGFINLIGAKNIFDSFEGWKSVSVESIIELNPDFIIIPQRNVHEGSDVRAITKSELFKHTNAGMKGNFIFDDAMAVTGFGPRTITSALKATEIILK